MTEYFKQKILLEKKEKQRKKRKAFLSSEMISLTKVVQNSEETKLNPAKQGVEGVRLYLLRTM